MEKLLTHEEYKKEYLGKKVDYDWYYAYQCVDLARDYCLKVWGLRTTVFWGSAFTGWKNRKRVFAGKRWIEWFAPVPVGSIVIFKPNELVYVKKPWEALWTREKLGKDWHVAIVDYIDNDWVMRLLEQNWLNGTTAKQDTWIGRTFFKKWSRIQDGEWPNAIRLRGYRWKDAVAWFILQN